MVSGMGLAMSIITNFKNAVERNGGTAENVHSLADPERSRSIWDQIAQIIVGAGSAVHQTFQVLVDYGKTLQEMIEEGKYDWVNDNITQENFPLQGKGKEDLQIELFHFGRAVTSKEAIEEMEKAGFRPATLPELLALGAKHPDLQKDFLIVALGSRWRSPSGDLGVSVLYWYGLRRGLSLPWFESDWLEDCRFAGVRK